MGGGFSLLWCYFFLPFFSVLARCVVLQRQHLELHVHVLLCHVCRLSARVRGFFFMPSSLRHVFNTILQCRLTSEGMSTLKRRLLSSFIISYFFYIFFFLYSVTLLCSLFILLLFWLLSPPSHHFPSIPHSPHVHIRVCIHLFSFFFFCCCFS